MIIPSSNSYGKRSPFFKTQCNTVLVRSCIYDGTCMYVRLGWKQSDSDRWRKVEIWHDAEASLIILRTTTYESNNQPYMSSTSKICRIVTRTFEQASQTHVSTTAAIVTRWSVKLESAGYNGIIFLLYSYFQTFQFITLSFVTLLPLVECEIVASIFLCRSVFRVFVRIIFTFLTHAWLL